MQPEFEKALAAIPQSPLADETVAMLAAVVADASAPDSAGRALEKSRQERLPPEQRAAAAALQAYGVQFAADVLAKGLESEAMDRADQLKQALSAESDDDALASLASNPETGAEFKSRLCFAVARKCAELIAAEIERTKKGPVTILNENDAKVFEARHEEHQRQRTQAATGFLASLPARFPSFGQKLFSDIREDVERHIKQTYPRPDIHAAVAAMFDDASGAMQASAHGQGARRDH